MASRKPTLALSTPTSACFPAEALKSAASVRTPHSAIASSWRESAGLPSAGFPSAGLPSAGLCSTGLNSPLVAIKTEEGFIKTPISPPVAYMDFLKLASPVATSPATSNPFSANTTSASCKPRPLHRASLSGPVRATACKAAAKLITPAAVPSVPSASSASSASSSDEEPHDTDDKDGLDSGPSTAASAASSTSTDCCSCDCERTRNMHGSRRSPKIARIDTSIPPSPFGASNFPTSAPAIGGRATFPSLKIPISPAISSHNASQINSPIRSPFSAKSTSITSPFDWEAALKARYTSPQSAHAHGHAHSCAKCSSKTTTTSSSTADATASTPTTSAKTSIRHIREVVTRTVTYTPRMNPPPKGKKRKMDSDEATC